jgi:hypothetical protein
MFTVAELPGEYLKRPQVVRHNFSSASREDGEASAPAHKTTPSAWT